MLEYCGMTNPLQVEGAWRLGWTLDVHTTSSVFLGYDEHDHAQFDTTRSSLGELIYQLKNKSKYAAADEIAATMADFLSKKPKALSRINLVVPVPASTSRTKQPVIIIASKLAETICKPFSENAILKTKKTPALKSITDLEERREALDDAFEGDRSQLDGKGILLVDDLYRSGSTANAVTLALIAAGASRVYFLAGTRTRINA